MALELETKKKNRVLIKFYSFDKIVKLLILLPNNKVYVKDFCAEEIYYVIFIRNLAGIF